MPPQASMTSTSTSSTAPPCRPYAPVPPAKSIVGRGGTGAATRPPVRLLLCSCPAGRSSTRDSSSPAGVQSVLESRRPWTSGSHALHTVATFEGPSLLRVRACGHRRSPPSPQPVRGAGASQHAGRDAHQAHSAQHPRPACSRVPCPECGSHARGRGFELLVSLRRGLLLDCVGFPEDGKRVIDDRQLSVMRGRFGAGDWWLA
jgi:hypothetical protein